MHLSYVKVSILISHNNHTKEFIKYEQILFYSIRVSIFGKVAAYKRAYYILDKCWNNELTKDQRIFHILASEPDKIIIVQVAHRFSIYILINLYTREYTIDESKIWANDAHSPKISILQLLLLVFFCDYFICMKLSFTP